MGATPFVWDGEVLAAELDDQRGPRAFVHEPGGFEPVLQQQGGETFLCVNDHLGMPKDLVSGDGLVVWTAAHSAYGRVIAVDADLAAKARYGESASVTAGARGTATGIESPFRLLGQVADEDAELGWTRFRCFDAESGRWLSPDPLGLNGGLNAHALDGAPSVVVDALGRSTSGGSPHPTAEAAAVAAMQENNAKSIADGKEYGGWVTQNADGTYSTAPPTVGDAKSIPNMPPPGPNDVAWWHTHGKADPGYDDENFSPKPNGDKGYSEYYGKPGYLATPSGAIKKYDPATDTVTTLSETAPTT